MYKEKIKKNQKYSFCTCGKSNIMPYCDNNHREYNKINNTNFKSIKIVVSENTEIELYSNMWDLKNNE